jgi:hypothetical protein
MLVVQGFQNYCIILFVVKIVNSALGLNTFLSENICMILNLKILLELPKNGLFYLQKELFKIIF